MAINNIEQLNKLPESVKYTLWFLRGLRDSLADYFIATTDDEQVHKEIESLCGYWPPIRQRLRDRLTHNSTYTDREQRFDFLWFIIKRIAYLEPPHAGLTSVVIWLMRYVKT